MSEQRISLREVSELQKREELKRSAKLVEIPEAKDIYRFLSIIVDSVKKFVCLHLLLAGMVVSPG
ncbi:MAG TPA: hypothetical protein ENI32_04180 [Candidatus Syntrophoarchaeum butanivorans]|uniref:Uncharacterized protein n=1 Tax=Candidatus Syntropharchaeum butanivorans TaxID=1839936 RepID=A0A1F2P6F7_9EURY|nr:MAG: hypothetical protein SBU_000539 [Candidatus Syntrophoarchaeum butanivorans]HEC57067.1 hypothetical protein [Candidatus Syntrophoarchaeum butanivorans]